MIPSSTNSPSGGHDLSAVADIHRPVPPPDRKDRAATGELPGLSTDETERRLKTEGANAIADVRQRPLWDGSQEIMGACTLDA